MYDCDANYLLFRHWATHHVTARQAHTRFCVSLPQSSVKANTSMHHQLLRILFHSYSTPYYSDGSWRNVGTVSSATVLSGGGAGRRATGRAACNTRDQTTWRSIIDVNVVGIADTFNKYTTPSNTIACRH